MAAIDMDTVKKKQAALKGEELTDDEKEKLQTAEKAKKQAVKDKISAVVDRINQLATTEPLKKFASLSKTKADLGAAQKLMKIAQGEEAEALKLKVDKYKEDITTYTDELEDYAKEKEESGTKSLSNTDSGTGDKSVVPDNKGGNQPSADNKEKIEAAQKDIEKAKEKYDAVKDGDDEKAKLEASLNFTQAQLTLSKLKKDDDEKIQGFQDEIKELKEKIKNLSNPPAGNQAAGNQAAGNQAAGNQAAGNETPESKEIEDAKAKLKEYTDGLDILKNKQTPDKDDANKIDILQKSIEAQKAKIEALRGGAKEGFQLDANSPLIKEAMKEANSLIGGGTGSPLDNIAKVNNTRDILRKAGLI